MKCPFRVITTEHTSLNGDKEIVQNLAECYGEECAAAYIVKHSRGGGEWETEVDGCKRLMNSNSL